MNNNEFEIMLNDLLKPVKETNVKIVLNKADDENFYFSFAGSPYKFHISKNDLNILMTDIQTSLNEKFRICFQWALISIAYIELNKHTETKNSDKKNKGILKKLLKIKNEALKTLKLKHKIKLNIDKYI